MTLSNFDWTDKNSVRWFILLPTGHEGPYSLHQLLALREQKKTAADVKVWCEGLTEPVSLKSAFDRSSVPKPIEPLKMSPPVGEQTLPPLPLDDVPPIPIEAVEASVPLKNSKRNRSLQIPWPLYLLPLFLFLGFLGFESMLSKKAVISIERRAKMDPELHQRIEQENPFDGWNKKIFFKEYVPPDHSYIWLISASFQTCEVEATFSSIKEKLLSLNDEKVSFKTQSRLSQHVVEFSNFDFIEGSRIIPGMYEMDIKATDCAWESWPVKLKNIFRPVDATYAARTKVILFSKGSFEFNNTLANLLLKKEEIKQREKNQNDIFWEDLQQKFETLLAISLQIEQHMLDFIDENPLLFKKNLKPMVDSYTKKFGSFLTEFVVENEKYFQGVSAPQSGSSEKRNYELMVRLSAKKIGLESMKFIEEFMKVKNNPSKAELKKYQNRLKKVFASIKQEMNQKIQSVAEDRRK